MMLYPKPFGWKYAGGLGATALVWIDHALDYHHGLNTGGRGRAYPGESVEATSEEEGGKGEREFGPALCFVFFCVFSLNDSHCKL